MIKKITVLCLASMFTVFLLFSSSVASAQADVTDAQIEEQRRIVMIELVETLEEHVRLVQLVLIQKLEAQVRILQSQL